MQILAQNKRVGREKFSQMDGYQEVGYDKNTKSQLNLTVYRSSGTDRIGSLTVPDSELIVAGGSFAPSVLGPPFERSAI